MVQLRESIYKQIELASTCFNSNMVQLRVISIKKKNYKESRFNSNMVQLRETTYKLDKDYLRVSIPIWFN